MKIIVALMLAGYTLTGFAAPSVVDTAYNPATGHTYELLSNSDWLSSRGRRHHFGWPSGHD